MTAPLADRPFQGVVPPVVTPLQPDGTIDHPSLERLVEHLITAGVDGLFALGSSGETAYLTDDVRAEVLRAIIRTTDGRVPVIAGAIELTAARVARIAQTLVEAGADAIVTTAPVYALPSVTETADHFRLIAKAIDVPLWAYDIPVRVHSKLAPELLVSLGDDGTIAGVKDSSGDDVAFRRLIAANAAAGAPLVVLTGHEVMVDAMGLAGADGVVPGLGNVDPAGYVRLWNAVRRGDWDQARIEQERLNNLFEIVFQSSGRSGDAAGVGAFKTALVALGIIDHAAMMPPVGVLGDDAIDRIRAIVAASGPALQHA